jgi:hypothetical protein
VIAANGDAAAVGLRELHLDSMEAAPVVGDQVVVTVLSEGDGEFATASDQIRGDPQLG